MQAVIVPKPVAASPFIHQQLQVRSSWPPRPYIPKMRQPPEWRPFDIGQLLERQLASGTAWPRFIGCTFTSPLSFLTFGVRWCTNVRHHDVVWGRHRPRRSPESVDLREIGTQPRCRSVGGGVMQVIPRFLMGIVTEEGLVCVTTRFELAAHSTETTDPVANVSDLGRSRGAQGIKRRHSKTEDRNDCNHESKDRRQSAPTFHVHSLENARGRRCVSSERGLEARGAQAADDSGTSTISLDSGTTRQRSTLRVLSRPAFSMRNPPSVR